MGFLSRLQFYLNEIFKKIINETKNNSVFKFDLWFKLFKFFFKLKELYKRVWLKSILNNAEETILDL